jgi:hypothetical protein
MLRHDSELRDDIFWRVFEVEGGGEISLTNIDKFSREDLNWRNTVILLSNEGTIDRARLLRSCLEALNRDFSAYRAGWFSQMYNALAPMAIEAAPDQDLLRQCLGSPVTATVSLGAKYLLAIQKQGLLDAADFVDACAPALAGSKVAAVGILRMLATIAAEGSASTDAIASAAVHALAHPHPDVQRAAVKLLVKVGRGDFANASRDALAPSVAAELLPEETPNSHVGPGHDHSAEPLNTVQPVDQWSDDDARERFSALLEFELELAMAWLARTDNASSILAPLVKRARKIDSNDGRFWIAELVLVAADPNRAFLPQQIWQDTRTVLVNGEPVERKFGEAVPLQTEEEKTFSPSLVTRMREVASIVSGHAQRRELLATPTDTHGWIDSSVLLDRLHGSPTPFPVDLTQAILRIRPADQSGLIIAADATSPVITESISIEWFPEGSPAHKPDGAPMWVRWKPGIVADVATEPSATQPALIPSYRHTRRFETIHSGPGVLIVRHQRQTSGIVASSLGLVSPASTLPLVAAGVPVMQSAMSEVNHAAGPVIDALASHPATWTAETAQVVALGMAAYHAELRTRSAELLASAMPSRISASEAAEGFAACEPAVALNRWTASLSDAATIAPTAVIELLTHLLPKLSRDTRGIGALLGVLVDESIRQHRGVNDPQLREWLDGFKGASGAAKAAKIGLALTGR